MYNTARLYPVVARRRQDFTGVKRVTIPNQTMSLKEMFKRYVRREPLPLEKKGIYVESDYDLEKVSKMDRVDQEEIYNEMKAKTDSLEAKIREEDSKIKSEKKRKKEAERAAAAQAQSDPKGNDGGGHPPVE